MVINTEDGDVIEFTPSQASPLGIVDLQALSNGTTDSVDMQFQSDSALINGDNNQGETRISARIEFHQSMAVFALVPGGWLPMPFAMPRQYLVDRNVVISMEKIRSGRNAANSEAFIWWLNLINDEDSVFNPLPYAYEASWRRKPSYGEFVDEFDRGTQEIRRTLPNCRVTEFQELHYRAAYEQLEAFDNRREDETQFLEIVCPLIFQRVGRNREEEILLRILSTADSCGVNKCSLVVIATLSCLYEDTHGLISVGRTILKPKPNYSRNDAYNALSDIGHIELALAGNTYFPENGFHLCTRDIGIAMLWSTIAAHGTPRLTGEIDLSIDLSDELFQRLEIPKIHELTTKLQSNA
jgi:hypothetical protein